MGMAVLQQNLIYKNRQELDRAHYHSWLSPSLVCLHEETENKNYLPDFRSNLWNSNISLWDGTIWYKIWKKE